MDSVTTISDWRVVLIDSFEYIVQQLVQLAPNLIGASILLLIGWLVASLLAKTVRTSALVFNKVLGKLFPVLVRKHEFSIKTEYVRIIAKVVFWLVIFFFVTAAAAVLGLDIFSRWISQLLTYFPQFIAGVLIISGGYLLSNAVRVMVVSGATSARIQQAELIGRSVQVAVLFTALVIGIEQLGIQIQFFTQLFIVVVAMILFSFSLAFGLGAKSLIANVIGAQHVSRLCKPGDTVAVSGRSGTVLEITSTTLILEFKDERISVPAHLFLEELAHIGSPASANQQEEQ